MFSQKPRENCAQLKTCSHGKVADKMVSRINNISLICYMLLLFYMYSSRAVCFTCFKALPSHPLTSNFLFV